MGWASEYIVRLQNGEAVQFRPRGNSMTGKIESGQLCTVEPVDVATLEVGDIVLCKVNGKQYLHLVKAIQGKRFQIGNNRGRINGWVGENCIFGKCTKIEWPTASNNLTCPVIPLPDEYFFRPIFPDRRNEQFSPPQPCPPFPLAKKMQHTFRQRR